MLDCLHRFEVKSGDCFLIRAGTPHAIGSGCLFVELHQPCDITLRTERYLAPQPLTDEQMHNGPGFDVLFDCFDYTGRDREQTLAEVFMQLTEETAMNGGTVYSLISYNDNSDFCMKKIVLKGSIPMPEFDGHYLFTAVKGEVLLEYEGGRLNVPQGRGVFVPASCREIMAVGNAELIMAYPFLV
jgi:mannose-6-phosphate isomerase